MSMYCGPHCISHVCAREGLAVTAHTAAHLARTDEQGTYIEDMVAALKLVGFEAEYHTELSWEDLRLAQETHHIIVDWWSVFDEDGNASMGDGHYSVVELITERMVVLFDPDICHSARKLPRAVFEAHWYDAAVKNTERVELPCAAVFAKKRKTSADNRQTVTV